MSHSIQEPAPDVPTGFALGREGLLVPAGSTELEREAWLHEDGMAIKRALDIARRHGVRLIVGCDDNRCADNPAMKEEQLEGGGLAWVCGHKRRILTTGPKKKGPKGFR